MNFMELIKRAKETDDFSILSENIPYMKSLGIEVHQYGGLLITTLKADPKLTGNPWIPALHGGNIGGLLEMAAIVQLAHDQETDDLPRTINITVEYLRTGFIKDLHAKALVTKRGRRVANVQVQCWQDELCDYWLNSYDWRAREVLLNKYPQFMTELNGLDIHFIHARSVHPDARPLLMTHGWPGSIVEFQKVIGPLIDPVAHGGDAADAFHVVCPAKFWFFGQANGHGLEY